MNQNDMIEIRAELLQKIYKIIHDEYVGCDPRIDGWQVAEEVKFILEKNGIELPELFY